MESQPLVRARFCQEWLARVEMEEEPYRSRFFSLLEPHTREAIELASRVAWVPLAIHVRLADITQEAFGAVRSHAYYRGAIAASIEGPILGPLLRTSARLLGLSPHTFIRWTSRAWGASFRNAGELVGEVIGPEQGRLTYSGLPTICTASDAWMLSAQASVYGALDLLRVEGVVRVDMSARSQGGMVLDLEWVARP
jgi:hypothetical protein